MIFKCKHPFDSLSIRDDQSVLNVDDNRYQIVTYQFTCNKCGQELTKSYTATTQAYWMPLYESKKRLIDFVVGAANG